jgi:hypothetical protein
MANDPLRGCPTCGTKVEGLNLGLRDYRWISDVLPGREAPMDIDAVIEKHGRILIQEFKPLGVGLPLGQRLTLRAFARKPEVDVWVVWEDPDGKHVEAGVMNRHGNVDFIQRMPLTKFRRRVAEWRINAASEDQ